MTSLTPAKELRAKINAAVAEKKAAAVERGLVAIKKDIEDNAHKGKLTVQTLMPEVVEALKLAGYKVQYFRAIGAGDVDTHEISW